MRFRVLGVSLFAVFALGVVVATAPAMAEWRCIPVVEGLWELQKNIEECELPLTVGSTMSPWELVTFLLALWLEEGVGVIEETMLVTTTGELTLENSNAPIINKPAAVLCSGILEGFVGPNSAGEVTELLNLAGELINLTSLAELALECSKVRECETGSLVWAVNLPWLTEVELWEEETPLTSGFVDLFLPHTGGGNVGWYVECLLGIIKASEECLTPEGVAEKRNLTVGVEDLFSPVFTSFMGAKPALCSGNNEETGNVISPGNEKSITVNSLPGRLSVSSEG